jgi:hypothetical protein
MRYPKFDRAGDCVADIPERYFLPAAAEWEQFKIELGYFWNKESNAASYMDLPLTLYQEDGEGEHALRKLARKPIVGRG